MSNIQLKDYFYVKISPDRLVATLYCTEVYDKTKITFTEKDMLDFLKEQDIVYGIHTSVIKKLVEQREGLVFPIIIAEGKAPIHGEDGSIVYEADLSSTVKPSEEEHEWDFREIMRIPSVKKGEKLATLIPPTKGTPGTNVHGKEIKARPGKPMKIRPGRNVSFNEKNLTYYAEIEGQINVNHRLIEVQAVYEVNETLSMKTGNLDFVGTIIIRGNVPTGYSVKAEGDVKIFGIVEAAEVQAGGSIYISEGLSGMQKGKIQAEQDIHIGYMNQGFAEAGGSIHVENSILHSTCIAKGKIYCQYGNIIGGSLSAGEAVEAKDMGNRMNTRTEIYLGIHQKIAEKEQKLLDRKKELESTIEKLKLIGKKLSASEHKQSSKIRITLLRQKKSMEQATKELEKIKNQLVSLNATIGSAKKATLTVRDHLYPNVTVSFGKYKRLIKTKHQHVSLSLRDNEITISPL